MFTTIAAPDFNLAKTLDSGQVFHWEKLPGGYCGTIDHLPIRVEQQGDSLKVEVGAPKLDRLNQSSSGTDKSIGNNSRSTLEKVVRRYFALDHPLARICAAFPDDITLNAAREFCLGLRIIRQPKWECLATFICSSMKQVAHIRQMSHALRERFGERCEIGGQPVFVFPSASRVARATEKQLRGCGLGYRAKNLLATARLVASGKANLDEWSALPDEALRENLCGLPGVGPKVANCVMLFAYERLRAFPIDVWIERVLRQSYFPRRRKLGVRELRDFCDSYFGEHGGYAQQYLFHHARKGKASRDPATHRTGTVVRPAELRYDLPVKRRSRAVSRRRPRNDGR